MITSLGIDGFKSFEPGRATNIPFGPQRVSLFYGLNGAGKSAISQVIGRHQTANPVPNCRVTFADTGLEYRCAVYNEDFIDAHFRSITAYPGIFTVGQLSTEALQRSESLQSRLSAIETEIQSITSQLVLHERQATRATADLTDKVYVSYQPIKKSTLRSLFNFGNDKSGWLSEIQMTALAPHEPRSWSELIEELDRLNSNQLTRVTKVDLNLGRIAVAIAEIESNPHWMALIVPSGDSRLAPFIQQLNNQDWVRRGQLFLQTGNGNCPYCQQPLPADFGAAITQLFDHRYDQAIHEITGLCEAYRAAHDHLQRLIAESLEPNPFTPEYPATKALAGALVDRLRVNLSVMRHKLEHPGEQVTISPTSETVADLLESQSDINRRVDAYNAQLDDLPRARNKIREESISRARWEQNRNLGEGMAALQLLAQQRGKMMSSRDALQYSAQNDRAELVDLMRQDTGVDYAVQAINRRLKNIGIGNFSLQRAGNDTFTYAISRDGRTPDVFNSLSEGEKTLITFLYFLETLTGSADPNNFVPIDRTVVVIDDPISSLSQNYVYDVADAIQEIVVLKDHRERRFAQVVVLTHNLFFLHELLKFKDLRDAAACFRVRKAAWSSVRQLSSHRLQNDYESLWTVVKDARDGDGTTPGAANAMRRILETFFTFNSEKNRLKEVLESLRNEEVNFRPFFRFIERGSHGDADTITDFGDFEPPEYVDKFRRVFEAAGFSHHYEHMMGSVV